MLITYLGTLSTLKWSSPMPLYLLFLRELFLLKQHFERKTCHSITIFITQIINYCRFQLSQYMFVSNASKRNNVIHISLPVSKAVRLILTELLIALCFNFAPSRHVAIMLFKGYCKGMAACPIRYKKYIIRLSRVKSSLQASNARIGDCCWWQPSV